jgi:hypothetical protein
MTILFLYQQTPASARFTHTRRRVMHNKTIDEADDKSNTNNANTKNSRDDNKQ